MFLPPSTPIIVPAKIETGIWTLPATIGGVPRRAVVGLEFSRSTLDPSAKLDRSGTVSVGGFLLRKGAPERKPVPPFPRDVALILGSDLLSDAVIGFDPGREEVALWRGGAGKGAAEAWIGSLPGHPKVLALPLRRTKTGRLMLDAEAGGRPFPFLLGTSQGVCLLSGDAGAIPSVYREIGNTKDTDANTGKAIEVVLGVAGGFRSGGRDLGLWPARLAPREAFPTDPKANGLLHLFSLPSRRVVVDFVRARLLIEEPTADRRAERALDAVFPRTFDVTGGSIVVLPSSDPGRADLAKRAGERLDAIGEVPAGEIVRALATGGAEGAEMLVRLNREREDTVFWFVEPNGERVGIRTTGGS